MKFLSSVCIAAIVIAIFKMLIPENKFRSQLSLLTAGVFLISGLSALGGARVDLSSDLTELSEYEDYVRFSDSVNNDLRKRVCDEMSEKVRALLNEHEIYPEEIHIIVNISGLYSISITQIKLVFGAGEQAAAEAAAELLSRGTADSIKIVTEVK